MGVSACRPEQHGGPRRRRRLVPLAGPGALRDAEGRPFAPAARSRPAEGDGGPYLIPKRFAADFLAARPDDGVVFVPGAVGGTSFWNHRWNPGDDLYDNLVALTKTVLAEHPAWRLRAMLFQGFETDATNGMLATTFRRALGRFVRGIRAELDAPELPIVFGELPAGFVDGQRRTGMRRSATRSGWRPGASPTPPSRRAGCRAVADDDGLHFSTAGLLSIGGRYAEALAAADANTRPILRPLRQPFRRMGRLGRHPFLRAAGPDSVGAYHGRRSSCRRPRSPPTTRA